MAFRIYFDEYPDVAITVPAGHAQYSEYLRAAQEFASVKSEMTDVLDNVVKDVSAEESAEATEKVTEDVNCDVVLSFDNMRTWIPNYCQEDEVPTYLSKALAFAKGAMESLNLYSVCHFVRLNKTCRAILSEYITPDITLFDEEKARDDAVFAEQRTKYIAKFQKRLDNLKKSTNVKTMKPFTGRRKPRYVPRPNYSALGYMHGIAPRIKHIVFLVNYLGIDVIHAIAAWGMEKNTMRLSTANLNGQAYQKKDSIPAHSSINLNFQSSSEFSKTLLIAPSPLARPARSMLANQLIDSILGNDPLVPNTEGEETVKHLNSLSIVISDEGLGLFKKFLANNPDLYVRELKLWVFTNTMRIMQDIVQSCLTTLRSIQSLKIIRISPDAAHGRYALDRDVNWALDIPEITNHTTIEKLTLRYKLSVAQSNLKHIRELSVQWYKAPLPELAITYPCLQHFTINFSCWNDIDLPQYVWNFPESITSLDLKALTDTPINVYISPMSNIKIVTVRYGVFNIYVTNMTPRQVQNNETVLTPTALADTPNEHIPFAVILHDNHNFRGTLSDIDPATIAGRDRKNMYGEHLNPRPPPVMINNLYFC